MSDLHVRTAWQLPKIVFSSCVGVALLPSVSSCSVVLRCVSSRSVLFGTNPVCHSVLLLAAKLPEASCVNCCRWSITYHNYGSWIIELVNSRRSTPEISVMVLIITCHELYASAVSDRKGTNHVTRTKYRVCKGHVHQGRVRWLVSSSGEREYSICIYHSQVIHSYSSRTDSLVFAIVLIFENWRNQVQLFDQ